jgi:hypothetical protein
VGSENPERVFVIYCNSEAGMTAVLAHVLCSLLMNAFTQLELKTQEKSRGKLETGLSCPDWDSFFQN